MKFILFCQNPYAFGIMEPIMEVLKQRHYECLWYLTENLEGKFPFPEEPHTYKIEELKNFKSDAIFCPGNEVPHFIKGVKVQIFHGLAGEKKGHFRIRHYFDLYLTQGPYFTEEFIKLKRKFKDFEVMETGWPKLDIYAQNLEKFEEEKKELLEGKNTSKLILYAPTFSPSLTSAPFLLEEIEKAAENKDHLFLVKFHDLIDPPIKEQYEDLASRTSNIIVENEPNILKFLIMADVMISDTSSVVYEFLLLDKPVITFKSGSANISWDNSEIFNGLSEKIKQNLEQDKFADKRKEVIARYHPYQDGRSAIRMVDAVESYITAHGVPARRKLPFLRKMKMNKMFKK